MGNNSASKPATPAVKAKRTLLDSISGHQGGVNCMALSEDRSVLATGSEDGTVRLWATKTKKCGSLGVLSGHKGYVTCILIEEVYVFSGSSDCDIIKWCVATCQKLQVFEGHNGRINKLVSTGDFIFSSSNDATLKCWDIENGELVRDFIGHRNAIFPVLFIPSNDLSSSEETAWVKDVLITGSTDHTARSWCFETGEELMIFSGHRGVVSNLATTLEGRLLFTASSDCTVRSWRVVTGEVLKVYEGHLAGVMGLLVVNRTVFTGGPDRIVRGWSVDWMSKEFLEYKGHSNTISNLHFYEGMLFVAGGDGTITCYEAKTAEHKRTFRGTALTAVNCVKFVESRMFTGSTDGLVRVWTLRGLRKSREKQEEKEAKPGDANDKNKENKVDNDKNDTNKEMY